MNNKFKLITPSASPTPMYRTSDGPSPSKRPRLTSSSTPSGSSSSISTPPAFSNQTYYTANTSTNVDGTELHDARRASSFRVLNIWSQLAERYSRPLAQDDIVDLRTCNIIKDRNVIRSTPHQYDIGYFGDADGGTETPTTDEGSDDELDAFAPGADISDELEMERVNREGLVPVREMDPADAEDLRLFLEAENHRREMFGSEGEEEGEDSGEEESGEDVEGVSEDGFPEVSATEGSTSEVEDELVEDQQWQGGSEHGDLRQDHELELDLASDDKDDVTFTIPLKNPDSGSDDELGVWNGQDEGSTVYAIAGDLDSDDLAEGEGITELLLPETPPPRKRGSPRKSTQIPDQSFHPRSTVKSISTSKRNVFLPAVQLHTPPQSSSSATGTTPDMFAPPLAIPMVPSSARPKPKPKFDNDLQNGLSPSLSKIPKTITAPKKLIPKPHKETPKPFTKHKSKETPSQKPKWVPEVVITMNASHSANSTPVKPRPRTRAVSQNLSHPESLVSEHDESPRVADKGRDKNKIKGKRKNGVLSTPDASPRPMGCAASQDGDEGESDDPMALVSSPDQHPKRTLARESTSESELHRFFSPFSSPSTPSRGRGTGRKRKRKRVLSSSAEANSDRPEEEGNHLRTKLPVISPDIDLIDFSRHRYDAYGIGMGHESPAPASRPRSRSRGKGMSGERASSSRATDADSEEPGPLKNTKRSSSRTGPRLFPPSNHNHNFANPNAYHYPYSETYTPHHTPIHNANHNHHHSAPFPSPLQQYQSMPPMQGPQAQLLLAQAMHHLSYLMTASGHTAHPHPNVGQPSWPQPSAAELGVSSSYGAPNFNSHNSEYTTPTHPRHRQRSNVLDSSPFASSSASTLASARTTPTHLHPYSYAFSPSLSSVTLPPSSPDQVTSSSPHTSPDEIETSRSMSLGKGRSKSRGRRVSFRIDDDRPHGLNKQERGQADGLPLRFEDHNDDVIELVLSSPSKHAPSNRGRSGSARQESSSRIRGMAKGAVMDVSADEPDPNESPSRADLRQRVGLRYERAQTPGPPSMAPVVSRSRSILRHGKTS